MNAIAFPPDARRVALRALAQAQDALSRAAIAADISGAFPAEGVAILRRTGAFEAFASLNEAPALELFDALRLVGRADLSLGRVFEGHVNAVRLVGWYGDAAQRRALQVDLAAGAMLGVWATEPPPGVQVDETAAGPVLRGAKSFATGCVGLQKAIITARTEVGKRLVLAPLSADRADAGGWRTRGMRATGSGLYDFTGVPVEPQMWLGEVGDYEREPRFTGGAWRFTAVQLGGVERLIMLVREHLIRGGGDQDPLQRAHFARAVMATRSAGLWVREAARLTEAGDASAPALALMTRGVVERAGLDMMEIAARAVGTRAFFAGQEVDRMSRDLSLYLRQAHPDQAVDRAAQAWLAGEDPWRADPWW